MANTDFLTGWRADIALDVKGASDPLMEKAIRDAAIEFCKLSQAWVYDPGDIAVGPLLADYRLEPPANAKVAKPLEVKLNGLQLTAKSPDELNALYNDWRSETGTPLYYVASEDWDTLLLVPKPTASGTMRQRLAIMPSQAATSINTLIHERYRDAIAAGAKARLMRISNQPWTNMAAASGWESIFRSHCTSANVEATKGFTRAPMRSRAVHGIE